MEIKAKVKVTLVQTLWFCPGKELIVTKLLQNLDGWFVPGLCLCLVRCVL